MNVGPSEEILTIVRQLYDIVNTYMFVNRNPNLVWGILEFFVYFRDDRCDYIYFTMGLGSRTDP